MASLQRIDDWAILDLRRSNRVAALARCSLDSSRKHGCEQSQQAGALLDHVVARARSVGGTSRLSAFPDFMLQAPTLDGEAT
jgi:hypothetical protein